MPRKKSNHKKRNEPAIAKSAGRPIWKGTINFGLVNIPVALYSAETDGSLDFDLLDRRDFSRVRYRRVNEKTGREVPWDEIVKGYEYKKGEYVALTDDDFLKANVEATQSIDILDFVDAADISPIYFDKPYYLAPLKNGQRAYALMRAVMDRNDLSADDLVSCIFTCTDDLDAEFPAVAARHMGLSGVPLLCAREIEVPGSLPRVIRLLLHCYADPDQPASHVYLRDAVTLRKDLEGAQ